VLLPLTALDDLLGSGLELLANLMNKRNDQRRNDGENELAKLFLELLKNLRKKRDLLEGSGNVFHDLIVELNGRHDVLKDLLDITSELLGLARRHGHVLKLSSLRVGLNLIDLVAFMFVTEQSVGYLIEKLAQHTGVGVLTLLESSLELVNLVLGQLVRYLKIH
jgi:hypothetical protein